ncbi:MAG: hypothetical protein AB1742_09865 [bacterium]
MDGKEGGRKRSPAVTALFVLCLAGAALTVGFVPALGACARPSPGEALTLELGRRYFAVTLLLALFENESPLYHLFSHFVLFLPGGFYALRAFSAACFAAIPYVVYLIGRDVSGRAPVARRVAACSFLALAPLLVRFSWKAEPLVPAVFFTILSVHFFVRAYVSGEARLRAPYAVVTLIALYTSFSAFPFFLVQAAYALRGFSVSRGEKRVSGCDDGSRRDLLKVFGLFVPGLIFKAGGVTKNVLTGFYTFQPVSGYDVLSGVAPQAGFPGSAGAEVAAFLLVFALFLSAVCYGRGNGLRGGGGLPALSGGFMTAFTLLMCISAFVLSMSVAVSDVRAAVEWDSVAGHVESSSRDGDGLLLVAARPDKRSYYLFSDYMRAAGLRGEIVPVRPLVRDELDLGGGFALRPARGSGNEDEIRVKELFLETDRVWVIYWCREDRGACRAGARGRGAAARVAALLGGGSPRRALSWMEAAADEREAKSFGDKFQSALYALKPGFAKDGILLDLLVNDLGERDKAARLIMERDFEPEMLRGYFHGVRRHEILFASRSLIGACAGDAACRAEVLRKIRLYAGARVESGAWKRVMDELAKDLRGSIGSGADAGTAGGE